MENKIELKKRKSIQLPQKKKKKTGLKISFTHSRFYIGLVKLRTDIAGSKSNLTSGFVPDYNNAIM